MSNLTAGTKANVTKTIPGQFYRAGVGIIRNIKEGVAEIELTTAKGVWGQLHTSARKPVTVFARLHHIRPIGEVA